jgi:arylsulfatase
MRDPYITVGPDGWYYLTATQYDNEAKGEGFPLWKSNDLVNWLYLGIPYTLKNASNYQQYRDALIEKNKLIPEERRKTDPNVSDQLKLWAPEVYFINHRWVVVHTSNSGLGNLALGSTKALEPPFSDMGKVYGRHHDPALFADDDGSVWLISKCTEIQKLSDDLLSFAGEPVKIGPSDRKMGHEGCLIRKIGKKYVLFGTAWSTDVMRHGTYNLYYCTADKLVGPYGPRKFAGRFLGHGTVFKDNKGRWWCTAFYNANVPALSGEEARSRDLSDNAYTINKQGFTLVPLEVEEVNGDVLIRAKDDNYANPGPEEVQKFDLK